MDVVAVAVMSKSWRELIEGVHLKLPEVLDRQNMKHLWTKICITCVHILVRCAAEIIIINYDLKELKS